MVYMCWGCGGMALPLLGALLLLGRRVQGRVEYLPQGPTFCTTSPTDWHGPLGPIAMDCPLTLLGRNGTQGYECFLIQVVLPRSSTTSQL